jgi:uncharacterized protein YcbX
MPSPTDIRPPLEDLAARSGPFHVAELWRYPVKSMRGERLERAEVRRDGIRGDRLVHVQDDRGLVTARTRPRLLGLTATLGSGDIALVEDRPWWDGEVARAVHDVAGPDAVLVAHDGPERFDILPLLVATDGAIAALGQDGRRLRPNVVLGGVEGLAERDWEGKLLVLGDLVVLLHSLRGRCIVTTFHPDTLAQDVDVLRDIGRRFDGTLALNAAVLRPGTVRAGDRAHVVDPPPGFTLHAASVA